MQLDLDEEMRCVNYSKRIFPTVLAWATCLYLWAVVHTSPSVSMSSTSHSFFRSWFNCTLHCSSSVNYWTQLTLMPHHLKRGIWGCIFKLHRYLTVFKLVMPAFDPCLVFSSPTEHFASEILKSSVSSIRTVISLQSQCISFVRKCFLLDPAGLHIYLWCTRGNGCDENSLVIHAYQ